MRLDTARPDWFPQAGRGGGPGTKATTSNTGGRACGAAPCGTKKAAPSRAPAEKPDAPVPPAVEPAGGLPLTFGAHQTRPPPAS
jgi:hypothetical protein